MQLELILWKKVDIVLAADASCEILLNALSKDSLFINDKLPLKKDYFKTFAFLMITHVKKLEKRKNQEQVPLCLIKISFDTLESIDKHLDKSR